MAALLVAIAIMMVLLGVAMPAWNHQARREREEELLFRLKQYAHAIALYQRRVPGASPPSIDILVEQRYLRRKYKDPVTGKDFALLRVGQVSPGMTTPLPGGTVPRGGGGGGGDDEAAGPGPGGRGNPGGSVATPPSTTSSPNQPGAGAIRGVVSTSTETSLRQWKGRTRYDEWEVTPEDIVPRFGPTVANPTQQGPGSGTGATPGGSGTPSPFGIRPGGGTSPRPSG